MKNTWFDNLPDIYCDLDEVVVGFFAGADPLLIENGSKAFLDPYWKPYTQDEADDIRWNILKEYSTFWLDLPTHAEGLIMWKFIRHYKPNILSALQRRTENCAEHKTEWVKKYIPEANNIHIVKRSHKKNYAINSSGKPNLLIDDYHANCNEWREAGGIAIQFVSGQQAIDELKQLGFK